MGRDPSLPILSIFISGVVNKQGGQQQDDANQHQAQASQLAGHGPAHQGQSQSG